MDDQAFLQHFESGTLESFHHRDHIRMAWLYLRRDGWQQGYSKIREGILHFAAHKGGTALYHETITHFWAHRVMAAIQSSPEIDDFAVFEAANPPLFNKTSINAFYNRALLNSQAAREAWIKPDLQPLPEIE